VVGVRVLIEGRPGSGKSTAAARLAELLRSEGVGVAGFTSGELRSGGRRVGFCIETLAGERGVLAHVELRGPPRVGKYGVDLAAFERLALPAVAAPAEVVIVDELGKMELASERFREAVNELFERDVAVVATVHTAAHPFTDALKRRRDVERMALRRANRDELPARLAARIQAERAA
jgi:nucleoside-triphosphatase